MRKNFTKQRSLKQVFQSQNFKTGANFYRPVANLIQPDRRAQNANQSNDTANFSVAHSVKNAHHNPQPSQQLHQSHLQLRKDKYKSPQPSDKILLQDVQREIKRPQSIKKHNKLLTGSISFANTNLSALNLNLNQTPLSKSRDNIASMIQKMMIAKYKQKISQ